MCVAVKSIANNPTKQVNQNQIVSSVPLNLSNIFGILSKGKYAKTSDDNNNSEVPKSVDLNSSRRHKNFPKKKFRNSQEHYYSSENYYSKNHASKTSQTFFSSDISTSTSKRKHATKKNSSYLDKFSGSVESISNEDAKNKLKKSKHSYSSSKIDSFNMSSKQNTKTSSHRSSITHQYHSSGSKSSLSNKCNCKNCQHAKNKHSKENYDFSSWKRNNSVRTPFFENSKSIRNSNVEDSDEFYFVKFINPYDQMLF